uniref:ADAMTS-like protein 1 n=1 Tax=Phallusia mammillata TaxID=59560 RepID=A0A6F9D5N3_9ASCI|nr:ADAMTS-like protein 1 [Phallusia mammillata]
MQLQIADSQDCVLPTQNFIVCTECQCGKPPNQPANICESRCQEPLLPTLKRQAVKQSEPDGSHAVCHWSPPHKIRTPRGYLANPKALSQPCWHQPVASTLVTKSTALKREAQSHLNKEHTSPEHHSRPIDCTSTIEACRPTGLTVEARTSREESGALPLNSERIQCRIGCRHYPAAKTRSLYKGNVVTSQLVTGQRARSCKDTTQSRDLETIDFLNNAIKLPQAGQSRRRLPARTHRIKGFVGGFSLLNVLSGFPAKFALFLLLFHMAEPRAAHGIPIRWHIGPYQDCNVTCGRGIQNRTVVCRRRPEGIDNDDVTEGLGEPMPDLMCPAPKPQNQRICSQSRCDPVWVGLRWGKCSRFCGRGFQERKVVCRQKLGTGEIVKVNDLHCPRKPPQTKRPCNIRSCTPRYVVKKWPPCRRSCGKEIVTRTVRCGVLQVGNPFPKIVNPKLCARQRRPPSMKNCNLPKCTANIVQATKPFNQTSREARVKFHIGSGAIVWAGTIVVIRCKVQKYWQNQIQWRFQGEPIDFDDERYQLLPGGSLRIHKVALQDSGAYTCLVGSSRADSLVLVTPDPEDLFDSLPTVTTDPDGIDVVVPPLVSLAPKEERIPVFNDQISFANSLSFIEEMDETPNERNGIYSSPYTIVRDVYETDSPNYLPEIDGDINEIVNAFQQRSVGDSVVLVSRMNHTAGHPRITSPPTTSPLQSGRDVTVYVGGNLIVGAAVSVTIFCEAEGDPFPVITWYREDVRLPEHLKRQYILADGSLRIYNPEVGDSGSYTCVASNPYGNDTALTSLTVTVPPRIRSTTEPHFDLTSPVVEVTVGSSITAKLGSKVLIRCPAAAHPKAYVLWSKDSTGLRQNARTLHDNTLEIYPTTEADQGLFGCEASNPSGSDYQASSLILIDPPHLTETPNEAPDIDGMMGNLPGLLLTSPATESYRVKAYSSVMMSCPVTGFPEPSIEWTFNGIPLVELGRTLDYQLMHQDRILQIPVANMETEGLYQCTASNEGGNFTTSLLLGLSEYSYEFGNYTQCTTTCGGRGTRYRRLLCIEERSKEVDEWFCTGLPKPALEMEPCNRVDCPPHFVIGPWGDCPVTCGDGVRTRATPCVVLMSDGSTREVAAEECLSQHQQPNNTMQCQAGPCPVWKAGPWRRCSKKCAGKGVGRRTRRIFCVSGNGTTNEPKHACKGQSKPTRKELCPNSRCEPLWVVSPWSVCSQSCGKGGIQTRILHCVFGGRRRQSAGKLCQKHRRPNVSGSCNRFPCKEGARITPPRLPPAGVPCINRSRKCPLIKRIGLCPKYRHLCCRICR